MKLLQGGWCQGFQLLYCEPNCCSYEGTGILWQARSSFLLCFQCYLTSCYSFSFCMRRQYQIFGMKHFLLSHSVSSLINRNVKLLYFLILIRRGFGISIKVKIKAPSYSLKLPLKRCKTKWRAFFCLYGAYSNAELPISYLLLGTSGQLTESRRKGVSCFSRKDWFGCVKIFTAKLWLLIKGCRLQNSSWQDVENKGWSCIMLVIFCLHKLPSFHGNLGLYTVTWLSGTE